MNRRLIVRFIGIAGFAFFLSAGMSGCGMFFSSGGESIGSGVRPNEFYPVVGRVQHPDSVVHTDEARDQIRRRWSVTFRDLQGGRHFRTRMHRTFATLWSKELAIADAQARVQATGMTDEAAGDMVDEAADEYMQYVKIDVHVFINVHLRDALGHTDLSGLNAEFELRDASGNMRTPTRLQISEFDVVRNLRLEPDAFYRINTLFFPRIVEEQDILEDISRLELYIRTRRMPFATLVFTWQFT